MINLKERKNKMKFKHVHICITHTNGVKECYGCRHLFVPESKKGNYQFKQYEKILRVIKGI